MIVPLKHVAFINREQLPESCHEALSFRYVDIGSVSGDGEMTIPSDSITIADAPSRARRLAPVGAIVVSTVRTYLRAVARVPVCPELLVFSTGFAVLEAREGIHPGFLYYLCRSDVVIDEVVARSSGVGYPAINASDMGRIAVDVPPLDQQWRIADFLDEQIGRFDRMVNLRRRLVELLTEKAEHAIRQHIAESLEVVGSDADAHGIPLKRILTKVKRPPMPEGETITAFRDGQVTARSRRRTEGFTEAWTESATFQGINVGDVVIHGLDGFAGAIGTSESEGVCSPVYHVCVPADGDDPYFIGRMLRILALSDYLSLFGGSARQRAVDFRNWSSFARTQVPLVEKSEQKKIGALLKQIQILEDAVTRYTSLIGERKQALITSAVTGQFDVTAARGVA